MILSSNTIKEQFESGNWTINEEVSKLHFGPNSLDVTLSENFLVPRAGVQIIDFDSEQSLFRSITSKDIVLHPGEFMLGSVNEVIDCSKPVLYKGLWEYFIPMYEGRSTIARLALSSHLSAGFGDYGFKGSFTLELKNNASWKIPLKPGIRIGQVYFMQVDSNITKSGIYRGYDQTDSKPQAPILGKNRI